MKIDAEIVAPLSGAASRARQLEGAGADGVLTYEDATDPFFPLVQAAAATGLEVYPSCCVAFPRSPTHLAQIAWDLQRLSDGGFKLGIASQVKAHIERRFGATWGRPVTHMHDLIAATRAVFGSWQDGERLDFHSEYYDLSLMTPAFNPGPLPGDPPPIWLGALGPRMTELAATAADGIIVHGLHTTTYLRERTLPITLDSLRAGGRARSDYTVAVNVIVGAGRSDDEIQASRDAVRQMVAFYASTPAYRVVLDQHGWGSVQEDLQALTRSGHWHEMPSRVSDAMLDEIAVIGTPEAIAAALLDTYTDLADRVGIYTPANAPDLSLEIIEAFRSLQA